MTFVTLGDLFPDVSIEVDVTTSPRSSSRTWTDITPYVRQCSGNRSGRNDEMQRTATGILNLVCSDQAGAVSGLGIKKRQWVRVRRQWNSVVYPLWQGIFESVPRRWLEGGSDPIVELHAADVLKVLRLTPLAGKDSTTDPTIFGAVRNDQRVAGIVGIAMLSTGTIDTDTDGADAVTTALSDGTDALSTCIDIEASENGLLVAEADGAISFQGRHYRLINSATSLGTFGESAGDIPYKDTVELDDTDAYIANPVTVTLPDGTTITVQDSTYLDDNWGNPLNRNLLKTDTGLGTDCANYLLKRYKNPSARIPQLDIQLAAVASNAPSYMPAILGAGNSDRFTWDRAASTPITADVYIEQVGFNFDRDGADDMTFQLSPASDDFGWVLGDAVNGLLGQTTVLAY